MLPPTSRFRARNGLRAWTWVHAIFQNAQHTSVAGFFPYGRMLYEHGGGRSSAAFSVVSLLAR
jgi:hypothetical protein